MSGPESDFFSEEPRQEKFGPGKVVRVIGEDQTVPPWTVFAHDPDNQTYSLIRPGTDDHVRVAASQVVEAGLPAQISVGAEEPAAEPAESEAKQRIFTEGQKVQVIHNGRLQHGWEVVDYSGENFYGQERVLVSPPDHSIKPIPVPEDLLANWQLAPADDDHRPPIRAEQPASELEPETVREPIATEQPAPTEAEGISDENAPAVTADTVNLVSDQGQPEPAPEPGAELGNQINQDEEDREAEIQRRIDEALKPLQDKLAVLENELTTDESAWEEELRRRIDNATEPLRQNIKNLEERLNNQNDLENRRKIELDDNLDTLADRISRLEEVLGLEPLFRPNTEIPEHLYGHLQKGQDVKILLDDNSLQLGWKLDKILYGDIPEEQFVHISNDSGEAKVLPRHLIESLQSFDVDDSVMVDSYNLRTAVTGWKINRFIMQDNPRRLGQKLIMAEVTKDDSKLGQLTKQVPIDRLALWKGISEETHEGQFMAPMEETEPKRFRGLRNRLENGTGRNNYNWHGREAGTVNRGRQASELSYPLGVASVDKLVSVAYKGLEAVVNPVASRVVDTGNRLFNRLERDHKGDTGGFEVGDLVKVPESSSLRKVLGKGDDELLSPSDLRGWEIEGFTQKPSFLGSNYKGSYVAHLIKDGKKLDVDVFGLVMLNQP